MVKTVLKLVTCLLYVLRVIIDQGPSVANWYVLVSFRVLSISILSNQF